MGDFCNGFPAYDALAKEHGKFDLILPRAMRMFSGIKDFVSYQGFTSSILFDDELTDFSNVIIMAQLPASFFKPTYEKRDISIVRPFMTCYVEQYLKANLRLDFKINDDYCIKIKDVPSANPEDFISAGDRWSKTLNHRRKHSMLGHIEGLKFLDFEKDIFYNLNIIKKSKYPFVSTFTGVSILADLIKKPNIVLWDEDMRNFMGWSPEFSFRKHYFTNRLSYIQYVNDFKTNLLSRI